MSSVDDRIVNMQFNNKQFTQGVTESQRSLDGLEQTLTKTAKSKGLDNMATSVDAVKNKFSLMQIAGVSAVATIASKATTAGLNILRTLTLDPITAGFQEYQTNLNSVQTIMANTGATVGKVNKALDQLNHYSDATIYNFSEMARNIGTFTAAGVDLNTSVSAIKGIANLAALSGSNSQQASTAMYQLSQAISAGRVGLQDWNSVVNAGMGGKVFQTALARTATAMGALNSTSVKMVGPMHKLTIEGESFRESISAKPGHNTWLSGEVLVDTLKQIAGGYTDAQLKAKGFSSKQIKAIDDLQRTAFDAATKIKTLPQLFGVVQESIGSMWSASFRTILGDFTQSRNLWSKIGFDLVGPQGTITKISNKFTGMLGDWAKMGGRKDLLSGFGNIFKSLGKVMGALKGAFQDIFPPASGNTLVKITKAFADFTSKLVPSKSTLKTLRTIFDGVFAALHIGFTVVNAIRTAFFSFFESLFKGSGQARGGILSIVTSVSEALVAFDKWLSSGGKLTEVFKNIGTIAGSVLGSIVQDIGLVIKAISGLGGGKNSMTGFTTPFEKATGIFSQFVSTVADGLQKITPSFSKLSGLFSGMGSIDFNWAAVLNTLFSGALILTIRSFVKNFSGFGGAIKGTFGALTGTLGHMQKLLNAKTLEAIAIAVALLVGSVVILSLINPKKLATAIGAISTLMGTLVASMFALGKVQRKFNTVLLAASILLISAAMVSLALAVTIFAHQDPKKVSAGIGFMAAALGVLMGSMLGFSKIKGTMIGFASSILILSLAMNILATAVLALGSMKLGTLEKGLGAIAVALGLFSAALFIFSKTAGRSVMAAGSILIISSAMLILSAAILAFGSMDTGTLVKGFIAMGVGLGIMVAALLVLSTMGAQTVLAAGAMVIMAAALNMMMTVILALGAAPWEVVARGIGFVALALGVLLLAGAASLVVGPGLIMLGIAVGLLGGAMALAGVGMLAFGTGFALMTAAGLAGVAVLTAGFQAFIGFLPAFAASLATAFVAFVGVIAAASPKLRKSFGEIFKNMIGVVTDAIPQIGELIQTLITTALNIIRTSVPQWIEAGFTIIDEFLKSANKHIPSIVDSALSLVTKFMDEISKNLGPLADSAAKMIIAYINAIADAINNNADDLGAAGLNMAMALVNGMTGGLAGKGLQMVKDAAEAIADALPGWMKKVLGIHSPSRVMIPIGAAIGTGMAKGIMSSISTAVSAAVKMANAIIAAGDASVAKAQRKARVAQQAADRAQAKADATRLAAAKLKKTDPKAAKALLAIADKQQKDADKAKALADAAAQNVTDKQTFAAADLHGKGDIRNTQAVDLAERASQMLSKANAEAAEAAKLQKTNKKAAAAMLAQSRKDAQAAKALAAQAKAANADANRYYASEVNARIKQLEADHKADVDAQKAQKEYDAADTAGKAEIMRKRAEADQKKSTAAEKAAADYLAQAKKLAATDAKKAMEFLDLSEQQTKIAQDAATQAQQESDQAAQLLTQGTQTSASGIGGIQPSRSILEDAAKAVDRYTESLAQASAAAAATPSTIQYVQNNTSPTALTASEIYRQTKNLLSTR